MALDAISVARRRARGHVPQRRMLGAGQPMHVQFRFSPDDTYVLGPMQVIASQFLMTLKDYPPSQVPGDWSLQSLERQTKTADGK